MTPRTARRVLTLALLLGGCEMLRLPTEPGEDPVRWRYRETAYGTIAYHHGVCPDAPVNNHAHEGLVFGSLGEEIGYWVESGFRRADRERPGASAVTADGTTFIGADIRNHGSGGCSTRFRCDHSDVAEHEMGHCIARRLGLWCAGDVWHPERCGYDMNCRRLPNARNCPD